MLLAQRGNKCESCGHGGEENILEVHHIIPILERPDLAKSPENIMLICNECHKRIHKELSKKNDN